jgi:hypothetical protein
MSEPIKFKSADERVAWDRYAAAVIGAMFPNSANLQNVTHAAEHADDMLVERRKRDDGHITEEATALLELVNAARNR